MSSEPRYVDLDNTDQFHGTEPKSGEPKHFGEASSGSEVGSALWTSQRGSFLDETDPLKLLEMIFGDLAGFTRDEMGSHLRRMVADIDVILGRQIDAVIHHEQFQKIEAAWRGVDYLVSQCERYESADIRIRICNVTWKELSKDFDDASEFDQSFAFRQIYDNTFGIPGGKPFGAIIANYELQPHPDDIDAIEQFSGVAAASFSPLIMGVSPEFLGVESFSDLESVNDIGAVFEKKEYDRWRAFRRTEDARYLGLALPHILMRTPYEDDGSYDYGFRYRENVSGIDSRKYLWGNAAFAFAAVLIRCYSQSNWLADIRGVQRGVEAGGIVTGLPAHSFGTDSPGVALKSPTDTTITDLMERDLSELGLLPLSYCHDSPYCAFFSNESAQIPKKYDGDSVATQNARISKMLQYILCSSRFAHYLKVLARDKIGAFQEASDLETLLQRWITLYVNADPTAGREERARRPLREAQVEVRPRKSESGHFITSMKLVPHLEFDDLKATVSLSTKIVSQ